MKGKRFLAFVIFFTIIFILVMPVSANKAITAYLDNEQIKFDTVGHTTGNKTYECEGAVISLDTCENFKIENCNLFGCGSEGLYAKIQRISL
ncbi:MAG: hypothetical protein GX219_04570 [Tissierellia bacterium]|nr:hypothetical protein [Tissierellia bacterium]